jgi:hypothetical protein
MAAVIPSMPTLLRRLLERLHGFSADLRELEERRVLLDRPWEEDFLHWARDEQGWRLHGHFVAPPRRRSSSVTSQGWCPGTTCTRQQWPAPPAH